MMVLVDTSVWVAFLAGREPYLSRLRGLLHDDRVLAHPLVYGELLLGDVGGGRQRALALYRLRPYVRQAEHDDVVHMVVSHRLSGRGLAWVDAHLLASALLGRVPLWTADRALYDAAAALGIAHPA